MLTVQAVQRISESRAEKEIYFSSRASRQNWDLPHLPFSQYAWFFFLAVKPLGNETDKEPLFNVEANARSYSPLLPYAFMWLTGKKCC